jgi:tetratricopeptide (TPR) repeat protein
VPDIRVSPLDTAAPKRGTNPLQDTVIRLEQAEQLRQQGKLDRAQRICEGLVREHPDYMAALHTLGLIHADRKNYQQALICLVRAVMLNPRSWATLTALSGVYLELNANEMAAQALEQARAIKPQDSNILATLGEIYRQEREYELAKDAFQQALNIEPNLVPAATGLGWVLLYLGQNAEAAQIFEGLLKHGALSLEIITALAYLPTSLISIDLQSEMDKLLENHSKAETAAPPQKSITENTVAFVRAAAFDKEGRYKEAWDQIVPANRTMFATLQDDFRDSLERERVTLSLLRNNSVKPSVSQNEYPISLFILGPSRSGKTTMETLVATLGGVKRGYENPIVDNAIRRTFQAAGLLTSSYFEMLPPQLYKECREIYLEELNRRAGSAKVFTNTHPARIFDAALISSVIPNVRFIFMKRNLEDLILRIYQRRYREWNSYSYDLKATRDYVIWYYQMIDLMAQKLPETVRVINYEDMVSDPSGSLVIAANLCGVPLSEQASLPSVGDDRNCSVPYSNFMSTQSQ